MIHGVIRGHVVKECFSVSHSSLQSLSLLPEFVLVRDFSAKYQFLQDI